MAQKIGGVLIDIATNVAQVKKDFDQVKNTVHKTSNDIKKALKTIGVVLGASFSVRAIKNFIVEGVKTIDTLQDMAQASGLVSRKFQGLAHAASYAGIEQSGVYNATKRLNTVIRDANYGLTESVRIFDELKIQYRTSQGEMRDTGEVLDDIANKFAQMEDGGKKAALAQKALGKSGADLIPVLNMGAEGLEKVTDRLDRLGGVITDETLERMDKVNQNITDMGKATSSIKLQVLAGMADELETMTNVAVKNAEAVKVIEDLGNALGKLGIWAVSAGVGFAGFVDLWGSFLGMTAGQISLGKFFDPEANRIMIDSLDEIIYKWGSILKDLMNPAPTKNLEDQRKKIEEIKEIIVNFPQIDTNTIWGNMTQGASDYYDTIQDRNKQIREATINGFKSMEDALVNFVIKGKLEWASLRDAILADIARIIIRQRIIAPLVGRIFDVPSGTVTPTMPTTASAAGRRRGRVSYDAVAANASNNLQNIVAENTYQMGEDVTYFVQSSERQFEQLGGVLRRNLSLSGRAGVFDPGAIPVIGEPSGYYGRTGGGALPGGTISGDVIGTQGIDLGPVSSISQAIAEPTPEHVAEAIKDTNIIPVVTEATTDIIKDVVKKTTEKVKEIPKGNVVDVVKDTNIVKAATDIALDTAETVVDAVLGEGTADEAVQETSNFLQSIADKLAETTGKLKVTLPGFKAESGINQAANIALGTNLITAPLVALGNLFHQGGIVGGRNFMVPRLHNGLANDEMLAILQRGEQVIPKDKAGSQGLTINVPVTIGDKNPAMARELRVEIEKTVIDVVRRYS